jgi:hypothetical protein
LNCGLKINNKLKRRDAEKGMFRALLTSILFIFLIPFSLAVASQPANADVTQKDFQVIIRSIGFLQSAQSGDKIFAIIYNPAIEESVAEAHQLQDIFKDNTGGSIKSSPRLVSTDDLSQLNDAGYAFVTTGLGQYYPKISEHARNGQTLTFTLDRSCVEQKQCIMYVNTGSRVEIVVNEAAAKEANVEFKPVFLMMITII